MDDQDPIIQKALFRFQVISGYLAADPPRGKRRQILEQLAGKSWILLSGEVASAKAETIRYWLRLYRNGGFEALKDKPRSDQSIRAIPKEIIEEACKLKLQVPLSDPSIGSSPSWKICNWLLQSCCADPPFTEH